MKILKFLTAGFLSAFATISDATVIGFADFSASATHQDFEGLGLPFLSPAPLTTGGVTYQTDQPELRYASSFGGVIGGSGFGLAPDSDFGFLQLDFADPVSRAGLRFGFGEDLFIGAAGGSARITFFDGVTQLHTYLFSQPTAGGEFIGWDAGTGSITTIFVQDISDNDLVVVIDDLYFEQVAPVPLPAGVVILLTALSALMPLRRKSVRDLG